MTRSLRNLCRISVENNRLILRASDSPRPSGEQKPLPIERIQVSQHAEVKQGQIIENKARWTAPSVTTSERLFATLARPGVCPAVPVRGSMRIEMGNRAWKSRRETRLNSMERFLGSSGEMLPQEKKVVERLGHLSTLNFRAMWAVSNLFRASSAVRRHMEASVLASDRLSWTSFATLWVLWIWGAMEVRELAAAVGVSRPTTTGVVATLKRRGCVQSRRGSRDGRSVFVLLTRKGRRTIERLFPSFNMEEGAVTVQLTPEEQDVLAKLLRAVLHSAEDANGSLAGEAPSARKALRSQA